MRAESSEKQLDRFIARYTPEVAALARAAVSKLRALLPHATILVYDNYNALAVGFGPSPRTSDGILSLALFPRWVSLFFLQGAGMPDPDRLLQGSGKQARHLVLPNSEALDQQAIRGLIATALERARVPIDAASVSQIVIKSVSEKQRPRRPVPKQGRRPRGPAPQP